MRFTRYVNAKCVVIQSSLSWDYLIGFSTDDEPLLARAENSGSESCYVEVVRWSNERRRWERFAFAKAMDLRRPDHGGMTDTELARHLAEVLNKQLGTSESVVFHMLPTWSGP